MKSFLVVSDDWQKSGLLEACDVFMLAVYQHLFAIRVPQNASAKMWKMMPWIIWRLHRHHWRICLRINIRKAGQTTEESLRNFIQTGRYERMKEKWGPAWDWMATAPRSLMATAMVFEKAMAALEAA